MHCTILCLSGKLIPARFASSCCPTNSVNVAFYVTRHRQVYHLSDNHTITTLNIVKFITCQVTTQSQLVNIVKFITCQVTTQSQLVNIVKFITCQITTQSQLLIVKFITSLAVTQAISRDKFQPCHWPLLAYVALRA